MEKASRHAPELLEQHKRKLLGSIASVEQQEVRWHLLQMIPRLRLTLRERQTAFALAESSLCHPSRIVQAEALSAMFELGKESVELRRRAVAKAKNAATSRIPALRARASKLLAGEN